MRYCRIAGVDLLLLLSVCTVLASTCSLARASHCDLPTSVSLATLTPCDTFQTVMGTTAGAPAGESVYEFAGVAGETYTFTFCSGGGTAVFDTGLSIWDGPAQLACNDDTCGVQSELVWPAGSTMTFKLRIGGFGGATGSYTLAYKRISPCDQLNLTAGTLAPQTVFGDAGDVAVLPFVAEALGLAHTLDTLTVDATGTGDDVTDISEVRLVADTNSSGTVTPGDVTLVSSPGGFPLDDGSIILTIPGGLSVAIGTPIDLLIVYDFGGSGVGGATFAATISAATVSTPAMGTIAGLPVAGMNVSLEAPTLLFTLGASAPASPVTAFELDTNVVVGQMAIATSGSAAQIDSLRLTASGTGDDAASLTAVRLFVEDPLGLPGALDPGDLQVAAGAYGADDGFATLAGPFVTALGATTEVLVVYDLGVGSGASPAFTYTWTLATTTDVATPAPGTVIMFGGVAAISGTAEVLPPCPVTLCGDCNGDGLVNIIDALTAAQHDVVLITLVSPAFDNCNVTGAVYPDPGAAVTVLDALVLAQIAAGLPIPTACCR